MEDGLFENKEDFDFLESPISFFSSGYNESESFTTPYNGIDNSLTLDGSLPPKKFSKQTSFESESFDTFPIGKSMYSNDKLLNNWNLTFISEMNISNESCFVSFVPRGESICSLDGSDLFSSIKYTLKQTLCVADFGEENIFAKIKVVDSENKEEIKKDEKSILKLTDGLEVISFTLNSKTNLHESKTKVQFLDNSYKHNRKEFSLQISYFRSDLINPILIIESKKFKVFARKLASNEKPKRKYEEIQTKKTKSKKQKCENKENVDNLTEIYTMYNKLTNEEKDRFKTMISSNFDFNSMENLLN
jgi:hypothetical protein